MKKIILIFTLKNAKCCQAIDSAEFFFVDTSITTRSSKLTIIFSKAFKKIQILKLLFQRKKTILNVEYQTCVRYGFFIFMSKYQRFKSEISNISDDGLFVISKIVPQFLEGKDMKRKRKPCFQDSVRPIIKKENN